MQTYLLDSSPLIIKASTGRLPLLSALLVISLVVLPLLGASPVQGAPAIASLTPTIGPPGSTVTLTGFIETASGAFQIRWDSPTGAVLFSGTALVDKSVSATFTIPGAPRDVHLVYLVDTAWSPPYGTANFNVTPVITLSPTIGSAGATVQITGAGFYSGETGISLLWDNDITLATGIIANASGSWSTSFAVPSNTTGNPTHVVDASGSLTTAVMVPDVTFSVVVPQLTITPASGPVGTNVTISGARFVNGETGIKVTYDGKDVKTGIVASDSGTWSTTYVIPVGVSGISHIFDASGAKMAANTVPDQVFAVTPSITATPTAGPAGTSVSVTGNGFRASETGVSVVFAEVAVQSGITASAQGSWTATVTVPEIPGGVHGIDAKGSITTGFQVAEAIFTVVPKINITPTSGSSGTTVTVVGSGFGVNEMPIVVTFGGTIVKDSVFADAKGSFSTTFTVPMVVSGIQPIDVYGGITKDIAEINFTVGARITSNPLSDIVGARVTVTGASFGKDETGIAILFDGAIVASGVVASGTGGWSATFTVPPAVTGNHRVTAYGNVTPVAGVSEVFFSVTPSFAVAPVSGNVDMQIALTGSGFAPGKTIAITYDNNPATTTPTVVTSNAQGSFSANVTIPRSRSGPHKIKVGDGAATREADWTLENTTPPLPSLTNPAREQRISLFGNVPVTLQWSAVSDPSGVYYSVQVSQTPDFTKPLLSHDNLTQPTYTTSTAETLPPGTYYWRAKAIDGAYNESAWTAASSFTVGLMPLWVFIAAIAGIIVVAVVVVILVRRRGGGKEKWWRKA